MKRINYNILHLISNGKTKEVIKLCYDNVDLINSTSPNSWSPLLEATTTGQASIVEFLLKKGAKVNHQDDFGNTALILLANIRPDASYIRLKNSISYWLLTLILVLPSIIITSFFTPIIFIGLFYSNIILCHYLIFFYPNKNLNILASLFTLLISSYIMGPYNYTITSTIFLLLLISLEIKDMILRYFIDNNYIKIIKMLLDYNSDKNIKNFYQETALDIAKRNNHKKMVNLLKP